jgi:ATP-dependent RNA helicase RhlE
MHLSLHVYPYYMTFQELGIIDPILKALQAQGYTHPTEIQEKAIPVLLKGEDLLGCAQTGTGKTAAFAVPILQHLANQADGQKGRRKVKALVVTPTRELALQIGNSFTAYGKFTGLRNTVIFGGVNQNSQTATLRQGVDILVATPGRLLDLIGQGFISLKDIEYFVLDEADHMLDMGFIHDIKRIIALLPKERQSLFFSATMPESILSLSRNILGKPAKVTVKPDQPTAERVDQGVYFVSKKNKPKLLLHLLREQEADSALVFSRTKYGADKIVKSLRRFDIHAEAIHGNKSQNARQRALKNFKTGKTQVLVATNIAARGIDVSGLPLVINFDLPNVAETYVHRIGRTGRARNSGYAYSFCNQEEREYLRDIQKLIGQQIPVITDNPFPDDNTEAEPLKQAAPARRKPQNGNGAPRKNNSNRNRNRSRNRKRGNGGGNSGGRS